jgi:hypothetical protein
MTNPFFAETDILGKLSLLFVTKSPSAEMEMLFLLFAESQQFPFG